MRDGTRLKLKAIRLPGGFRTTQQWLDEFIEALTRDRTGAPAPSEVVEERARRAEMALAEDGWRGREMRTAGVATRRLRGCSECDLP
jgi:hypothetical protein